MLFIDSSFFSLKLAADVREELLEVLRVIHDEFVDDGFVEVHWREFVGVSLYDHWSHIGEVLRHNSCALLHDKDVFALHILKKLHIGLYVLQKGLKANRDVQRFFNLGRPY